MTKTAITYVCDRCGDESVKPLNFLEMRKINEPHHAQVSPKGYDLCNACFYLIRGFLEQDVDFGEASDVRE